MRQSSNLAAVFAITIVVEAVANGFASEAANSRPNPPSVSSFAPAEDLLSEVNFYVNRIEEAIADKNEFDDAAMTRLRKDANTLAAIFLALGLHDDHANRFHDRAPELVKTAGQIAKATDLAEARTALVLLNSAMAHSGASSDNGGKLTWDKNVASFEELMKQVPSINSALKRAVTPERLKAMQHQSAAHSAALAAVAQTVMADTSCVKNPGDLQKWYDYCAEMRTAAGAVNAAIHAQDQEATTKAMARLATSCETCHRVFRKE